MGKEKKAREMLRNVPVSEKTGAKNFSFSNEKRQFVLDFIAEAMTNKYGLAREITLLQQKVTQLVEDKAKLEKQVSGVSQARARAWGAEGGARVLFPGQEAIERLKRDGARSVLTFEVIQEEPLKDKEEAQTKMQEVVRGLEHEDGRDPEEYSREIDKVVEDVDVTGEKRKDVRAVFSSAERGVWRPREAAAGAGGEAGGEGEGWVGAAASGVGA